VSYGKTSGAIRFALIFLLLFLSRKKVNRAAITAPGLLRSEMSSQAFLISGKGG
jgi:hypothetical protein